MRDSSQPDWTTAAKWRPSLSSREPISTVRSANFSGGWQTRVKLAAYCCTRQTCCCSTSRQTFLRLAYQDPCWKHFLRNYDKACLIVSHDRAFLSATCDHTLGLSRSKLTMYPGKIDAHRENQQERRKHDERANAGVLAKTPRRNLSPRTKPVPARQPGPRNRRRNSSRKLEFVEIAAEEATVGIRAPRVEHVAAGPFAALTCPWVIPTGKSPRASPSRSNMAPEPRSSVTTGRERQPSCERSSTR